MTCSAAAVQYGAARHCTEGGGLPFTGLNLWALLLVAALLILAGAFLYAAGKVAR